MSRVRGRHHSQKSNKGKLIVMVIVLLLIIFLGWLFFAPQSSFKYAFPGVPGVGGPSYKTTDGKVNVLLLGLAGGNHDGALLTDSIIVASYDVKAKKATMFSIPRDLWVEPLKMRVNAIYQNGGEGMDRLTFAEQKIGDIVGLPIHYGVRIDFGGFVKAIDLMGGVNIEVPKSFTDAQYPIEGKENDLCGYAEKEMNFNEEEAKKLNIPVGKRKVYIDPQGKVATDSANIYFDCRYETIKFEKGPAYLDGTQALKFVRSRHGTGDEGSDFARSRRQQLVIQAFRDKVFSLQTLTNPQKILELINTLGNSIQTDVPPDDIFELYKLSKEMTTINNVVLGDLGNGKSLLANPPASQYGGAWVLIPPNNDFTQIHKFVQDTMNNLLLPSPSSAISATPSASPRKKP